MDCIFCKIIAGQIPSAKIRENDEFVAILDAFPACKGQALVMTKAHIGSDVFVMPNDQYSRFLLAVKEVVALLRKGLQVERIGIVVEGMQVDHAHIKLYPFRGGKSFEGGLIGSEMAKEEDLQTLANQIRNSI
ncbi:MAG: diadenosine tetraphosphate hydrolase [candidate division SR1 bacterium CG_4_9_14_3_um_filter_40_9]|nr:MAG: diadenosine tetraphosphate hydrolase [candidate division SR1 bacterium CG_4_9_14_3_um_filter_40_9]